MTIPDADARQPLDQPITAFDAGDMGCGEIVLELRFRLGPMAPGTTLRVRATDPGVREDLPAWCRMTGHTLLDASPPFYLIQRRPS